MEESISLEETNKIRISLGLKPLSATKDDSADSPEKQAEDNFAKKKEQEAKDRESKRIQDRIAKVKNKRELNASLKGATLGDPDADGDDALSWVKKSKKREKLLAKKRMEELENMDKLFQEEYTEKDLQGLKVSHNFEELGDGEDRILTLKDSRILDNEEDELQNVEMAEEERNKKNNELKIKKKDYKGYDDEEFGDGQSGVRRSILAKYDEDLEGTSEIGFRLGSSVPKKAEKLKEEQQAAAAAVNKSLLSIDYSKNLEVTDYLQEGDVGFKKPKTKKKRPSRRVAEDSGIEPVSSSNGTNGNGAGTGAGAGDGEDRMDIDVKPTRTRTRDLDMNFIDDDELQASLARARRAKMMKKPKVLTQEEVARKLVEERIKNEASEAIKLEEGDDEAAGGLVFDDTSEFIRSVQYNPEVKQEPKSRDDVRVKSESTQRDVHMKDVGGSNGDDDADNNDNDSDEDMEAGEIAMKEEEDEEAILHALQHAIDTGELNLKQEGEGEGQGDGKGEGENGVDSINGTSSQLSYGSGIGATLNILRQQGILSTPSSTQQEREKTQRQRDIWLAEYRTRLALRELERVRAKGEKRDQAQREYENRVREQQEAREGMEMFREYKPDVNIVYHDEFGRELSAKEAWKALSHRFHGKGSGKMKTEKRLKKIAEERKKEAMASGDTPLSMNRAFQQRQEKTGQAHFVLSVGNRGAVPQVAEYLEPPTLSKGKTEKSKKKKDTGKEDKSQGVNSFNSFNNFLNSNGVHNNHNHNHNNSNFNTNNAGSANSNNNIDITGFTSRPLSSSLSPGPGRGFSPISGVGHSNGASPSPAPAPGLSPGPGPSFGSGFGPASGPGSGTGFGSGSGSMMKKSFSQVSEPASGAGTPIGGSASGNGNGFGNGFGSGGGNGNGNGGERGGERVKVAFGFGTKRKAAGEGMGTPPQKRR